MSLDATNQALINAVHALANKKLQTVVNAAKRAASAGNGNKNKEIARLTAALAAAEEAAKAATAASPGTPAALAVVINTNKLINNIGNGVHNNRLKANPFNNLHNVNGYTVQRKNNINAAISAARSRIAADAASQSQP